MDLPLRRDPAPDQHSTQAVRDTADAAPLEDSFGRDEMARRRELESVRERLGNADVVVSRPDAALPLDLPKVVGSRGVREAT